MIALASRLDELGATGTHVVESANIVSLSNLSAQTAVEVWQRASALSWPCDIYDLADTHWDVSEVNEAFGPFRVSITKPCLQTCTRILTNIAFSEWLCRDFEGNVLQVARLKSSFDTYSIRFTPWQEEVVQPDSVKTFKSPRSLVREYGDDRKVPRSVSRWLLLSEDSADVSNPTFRAWMKHASLSLLYCIPDEIDSEEGSLKFKGPPRLSLSAPLSASEFLIDLTDFGFWSLHRAVVWIFENEREAEMRHILFATEIARSGAAAVSTGNFLDANIIAGLEGARIGYQASLSQISGETLKALADLRKAVTDETAKVSESTRQITGAVATALATGAGLIAAKITLSPTSKILTTVMIVAVLYVSIVIVSGIQFTIIQKSLRDNWQARLYRFIPTEDYQNLVTRPVSRAEQTLWITACLGGFSVLVMAIAVIWK